jgi:hypothetical protein
MAAHPSATAVAREESSGSGTAVYTDGMLAGVAGGGAIALWFLLVDVWNGRPFYTPTVLGAAVFGAGAGDPATAIPSLDVVLPFTWLHLLVFVVLGVVASRLLAVAERDANYGFGVLLLFVIFEIGFVAASLVFAEQALRALAWPAVVVGNLLAAAAMAWVLWRRHPRLRVLP